MGSDIIAVAAALACCVLVLLRLADRWKSRLRGLASPLMRPAGYRALFLLVVVGALLISTLPEAAFVLPALDAIGLDLVTILVALELRHYIAAVTVRIPAWIAVRANPALWPYDCMWPVIWLRTLMGKMSAAPPACAG
jgi:hypothetical protein